jgi:hypothetical protein
MSTGISTKSPWLRNAPPWAPGTPANDAISWKRTAEEISVAEATLGKFAELYAAAVTQDGWEAVVLRARGKSSIS